MKKIKSLAELLNESNLSKQENQSRVDLSNPGEGFMDGTQFDTRLGTIYVEISETARTGVTLDVAFASQGKQLGNDSEIVRVTISPDGTIRVVDRSSGRY